MDDGYVAAGKLPLDFAVIHDEHVLVVAFDHRTGLCIVDQVGSLDAGIGDEDSNFRAFGICGANPREATPRINEAVRFLMTRCMMISCGAK